MTPLDEQFNHVVALCCADVVGSYDVSEQAPATYHELMAHMARNDGRLCVWSGASDQTIFAHPAVNWAFRAWHDYYHWKDRQPFTVVGELMVAFAQCDDIERLFPEHPRLKVWQALVMAEVVGQREYADAHGGRFPTDQHGFVAAWLSDPVAAIKRTF